MPIFLRDPKDTSGQLRRFEDEADARRAIIDFGWEQASPQEIEQRTLERQYGDRDVAAFGRAAAAGVVDAAVAPVRLAGVLGATLTGQDNKDPFGELLSGRNVTRDLAGLATELAGGGNQETAARQYEEESRAIARANPWSSTAGYIGGNIAGGFGLSGAAGSLGKAAASAAASSVLGRTAARQAAIAAITGGAAEGAALSTGQLGEEAFIADHKLTSEQVLGALGWGTLLGGGIGGGLYGAGAIYRGGKRLVGGAADAASESARQLFGGPTVSASAETVNEVGERVLGVKPGPDFASKAKDALNYLRDQAENAQAASTAVSPEGIKKYGGLRWDSSARRGRDLYLERDAIIEGAKKDFAADLTAHGNSVDAIADEVFKVAPKKERIAQRLSDNVDGQLAEARAQADALEERLLPIRQPGKPKRAAGAGGKEAIDREAYLETFQAEAREQIESELDDEISDLLETMGGQSKPGSKAWRRAEQQVLHERVAPQVDQAAAQAPVDPRVGALVGEVGHPATLREIDTFFSRQLSKIRETADPAEAYVLLDRTKAAAQKWADSLGRFANGGGGGGRPISPEKIQGARRLAEHLDSMQEPLRQSLMNEGVWGAAGADQRTINALATRYIESSKIFNQRFMTTESVGYMGKSATRIARDDRVGGFLDRMGKASNVADERYLRAHLKTSRDFSEAIHEAVDLGEKAPMLEKLRASEAKLSATLDKLDHTVSVANQIDEVLKADSAGVGSAGKTLLGAMLGGAPGALLGLGADVATNPGRMMRMAIGIQRVAKRFDVRMDEALDGLFEKKAPTPHEPPPSSGVKGAVADEGEEVFKDEVSGVRPRPEAKPAAQPAAGAGALGEMPVQRGELNAKGGAVPLALSVFLGEHTDKQKAFAERAREIYEATADLGEGVRQVVTRDLGDVQQSFPQFSNALVGGLTRGAIFLESKLPRSYRAAAPGAQGRSTRPVADHDIAKFARYWSAVHDPVSVLTDMQLGMVTAEQIEAVRTVYPELWVNLSQRLLERAAKADADGRRIPMQTRRQMGRFAGVQIEPAFRTSVLDLIDQARGARDQEQAQGGQNLRRSQPLNLAKTAGPESTQIQQRQARVY